jgi:solute carrier family 35 protein E1
VQRFWGDLFMVGLLYHLYNQFAFNTLQRVSPVSHGVCNVVKRVVIIFSSVIFFNQVGGYTRGVEGGRPCVALRS